MRVEEVQEADANDVVILRNELRVLLSNDEISRGFKRAQS